MMKKVGIILRPDKNDTGRYVCKINDSIRQLLSSYDVMLIGIIPKSNYNYLKDKNSKLDKKMIIESIKLCDGIIMPGGYGPFDYDYEIVSYCYVNNIPILGICLGMQVMGEVLGGITVNVKNPVIHNNKKLLHEVNIEKNSFLSKIIKQNKIYVNTRHKETVTRIDEKFVNAKYNNIIEGIEDKNKIFFLGLQWHPEDLNDESSKKIFDKFIDVLEKKE